MFQDTESKKMEGEKMRGRKKVRWRLGEKGRKKGKFGHLKGDTE